MLFFSTVASIEIPLVKLLIVGYMFTRAVNLVEERLFVIIGYQGRRYVDLIMLLVPRTAPRIKVERLQRRTRATTIVGLY